MLLRVRVRPPNNGKKKWQKSEREVLRNRFLECEDSKQCLAKICSDSELHA